MIIKNITDFFKKESNYRCIPVKICLSNTYVWEFLNNLKYINTKGALTNSFYVASINATVKNENFSLISLVNIDS